MRLRVLRVCLCVRARVGAWAPNHWASARVRVRGQEAEAEDRHEEYLARRKERKEMLRQKVRSYHCKLPAERDAAARVSILQAARAK